MIDWGLSRDARREEDLDWGAERRFGCKPSSSLLGADSAGLDAREGMLEVRKGGLGTVSDALLSSAVSMRKLGWRLVTRGSWE